jgi:hypothetical protein
MKILLTILTLTILTACTSKAQLSDLRSELEYQTNLNKALEIDLNSANEKLKAKSICEYSEKELQIESVKLQKQQLEMMQKDKLDRIVSDYEKASREIMNRTVAKPVYIIGPRY